MPFEFSPTSLPAVLLVRAEKFGDERGFFMETYQRSAFAEAGVPDFVQDNASRSAKGVLRGLHYQMDPWAQGKLVRAARGAIYDVAVDLRQDSPRLGEWVGFELTEENRTMLYIPPGFAHGFLVMSDGADVHYKTTREYHADSDRSVRWDDADLGIAWPDVGMDPLVSEKDERAPAFADAELFAGGAT